MWKARVFVRILFISLIFTGAIPRMLNYQGKLTDSTGTGINGTLPMTFKLYTTQTGGSPIWSENQNVSVTNGLFSVLLGSSVPFPDSVDFSTPYWLEIVVNGEPMEPREQLTSAPYAIYADRANRVVNAIQSVFSDSNATRRTGNFVFRAGHGATLSDDGSNIYLTIGSCGGSSGATPNIYDVLVAGNDAGGRRIINLANPDSPRDVATKAYVDSQSVSSITGGAGLSPDTPSKGNVTMHINVDNATIEVYDDVLRIKPGGVGTSQIAPGAITTELISSNAVTTEQIAPGAITTERIAEGAIRINQLADFDISGANTGDIMYYDASVSKWVRLAPGNPHQVLETRGAGSPPGWVTPEARAIYNFILSASPSSGRIPRGDSTTISINATEVRGESPEYIRFYAAGLPTGATASFSPDSCQPSGGPPRACSSTMKIRTTGSASSGTYAIPITGVATGGATATAIYTANIGVPGKVTGVTVSGCYNLNRINITWSTPDDGGSPITHYNIYRSTSSGNEVYYTYVPAPTTTFRDTNVTVGTTYYYQVSAVNAVGEGDRSNEVNITAAASSPLASCKAILDAGCSAGDGVYTIDPDGVGGNAPFQAYCDMTTDGGGWTMCLTERDNMPHISSEYTYRGTFGTPGYRTDCRNIPFSEILYINHDNGQKAWFTRQSPGNIVISSLGYCTNGSATGLWTAHGVASTSYNYQLNICDCNMYVGLMMSGYTSNCWKDCNSWCSDTGSPYFRWDGSSSSDYNGVAFNENGHRNVSSKTMSAGIR